jgi:hypothetical protein
MKAILKPVRANTTGFALMITLVFVAVSLILLSSVMYWASTNGKITQKNMTFTKSEAAAEAATEQVFTMMNRDFLYSVLNSSSFYATNLPDTTSWDTQYSFSDPTNNVSGQTYVYISSTNYYEPLASQYAGLYGDVYDCYITSTATPNSGLYTVPATISQYLQAAVVPVFQYAIFYNLNMEMDPTPAMTVNGPVFCNKSIWVVAIGGLTFNSTVQAVGTNDLSNIDPFANNYSRSGTIPVTFTLGNQPTSGNKPLVMPIAGNATTNTDPTNIEAILNLPPTGLGAPNSAAYATTNQIYLFNECDLIISNSASGVISNWIAGSPVATGTNITIWFEDGFRSTAMQKLTNEVLTLRNTSGTNINNYAPSNILSAGFTFVTNSTFYDYRESDNCQAMQIDVSKLSSWLTNTAYQGYRWNQQCISDKGHPIDSIYVYNNVPLSATNLPCVRLVNGGKLPTSYGLTVATPMPAYIYGNYNVSNGVGNNLNMNSTTYTYPASVLADAVTILSGSWNDTSYTSATAVTSRIPTATTVNAAMFEGIVQSNPNISGNYSGGVENFLRMLENWGNGTVPLYYNGSIVVAFPSIYATNLYVSAGTGSGNYYQPPQRNWAFDNNFKQAALLPPLTPSTRALIRGQWTAY